MGVDAAQKIASFVRGEPCELGYNDEGLSIREGTFHICYWVSFGDGIRWVVRFPLPGMISWEMVNDKIATEVATLKFLKQQTSIPVPAVVGYGFDGDNHPTGLPFIILKHVSGFHLSSRWESLIPEHRRKVFEELADISLELNSHHFDHIGALGLNESEEWILSRPPINSPTAHLKIDGVEIRMNTTFSTSIEFFLAQYDHIWRRYTEQRNSVYHEEDAREKYVRLQLFKELLPTFNIPEFNDGPFTLMHSDLHQSNVLVDDNLRITAILDWEWACVLPIQISCLPPICLSLKRPAEVEPDEYSEWLRSVKSWIEIYERKESQLAIKMPVAGLMKESLQNRKLWFAHAIMDPYWFEYIFDDHIYSYAFDLDFSAMCSALLDTKIRSSAKQLIAQKLLDLEKYTALLRYFLPLSILLTRSSEYGTMNEAGLKAIDDNRFGMLTIWQGSSRRKTTVGVILFRRASYTISILY